MLTFAPSVPRAVHTACCVRSPARWRWPGLVALVAALSGLTVQAEPVTISPEGVRASAVDMAFDAEGTAWLLWVQKGARIPGAGHASADDLYLTRWPADGPAGQI